MHKPRHRMQVGFISVLHQWERCMALPRSDLLLFRAVLVTALLIIFHLATTQLHYPGLNGLNDKVSHIMAFYALAMLEDFSFPRTGFGLSKAFTLMAYGLLIEVIQYFLPYRTFSLYDLGADAMGVLVYVISTPVLKQIPFVCRRWSV
jgi:VanZ family protein